MILEPHRPDHRPMFITLSTSNENPTHSCVRLVVCLSFTGHKAATDITGDVCMGCVQEAGST